MNATITHSVDGSEKKPKNGKNKRRGHWGKSGRPNIIEWSHPDLGSIWIELKQFPLGKMIHQEGPNTWCRVDLGRHKPTSLVLEYNYSLNEGVELLHARDKRVIDTAKEDSAPFVLEVEWKPGPRKDSELVPYLPKGYGQDFQLFPINTESGFVVHLDISFVSRNGVFWVAMQEVTGGQIIRHPVDSNIEGHTSILFGDDAYTVVPVYGENCYEGFDPVASWNRTYDTRADKVLGYAVEFGAAIPFEQCTAGVWQPEWPTEVPAALVQKGYKKAVVQWFNLTLGYGMLQLEDGQLCFAHFKSILDEKGMSVAQAGDFPVLQPSKGCYVKYQEDPTGQQNPKATAVRPA